MGSIVLPSDDITPPYIKAVYPPNGYDNVGIRSSFTLRVQDSGDAKLDVGTLQVSVDSINVIEDGSVLAGTAWEGSEVRPWEEGATSIMDVVLSKNIAHGYGHEYVVEVSASDNNGNTSSRVLNFSIQPTSVFSGASPTDLSPLELSVLDPFSSQYAEKFRARILYGLVPGAETGNSLETQAARRLTQLIYGYRQDPFVAQYWEGLSNRPSNRVQDARDLSSLESIGGQFREATRLVLAEIGRGLDQILVGYIEELMPTSPIAASLCLLAILCKARDAGASL